MSKNPYQSIMKKLKEIDTTLQHECRFGEMKCGRLFRQLKEIIEWLITDGIQLEEMLKDKEHKEQQ